MPRAGNAHTCTATWLFVDELAAAARWVVARAGPASSASRIAATFEALQAVALRARRWPVCIRDLLPGSGLEVLHIPAARSAWGRWPA